MFSKEHILDEIRRTAEENGGNPLGWRKFTNETGIKEYDWKGEYWARWNDAVLEAGLQPNEMQGAFSDEALLTHVIHLARRLGTFPTISEMRLEKHRNANFPNTKVFERRFGGKRDLIHSLSAYCAGRVDFVDIEQICEDALGVYLQKSSSAKSDFETDQFGYVYLLKSGRYYKIGKSNAVGRRERELAIQLPEKASTVHSIKTDDPAGIEAYWHKRFESRRKNGEWFELSAEDVRAFKRRKFM